MRTYDEHLEWCKQRAREYLERGDLAHAVASMMSDLGKHPETRTRAAGLHVLAAIRAEDGDYDFVKHYIEGFR